MHHVPFQGKMRQRHRNVTGHNIVSHFYSLYCHQKDCSVSTGVNSRSFLDHLSVFCCIVIPGLESTFKIWVSVRKTCPVFGFPWQFLGFLSKSLTLSVGLTIPGFPVGNPGPRIGFPPPFLGVPDIRKPSNFEPCYPRIIQY